MVPAPNPRNETAPRRRRLGVAVDWTVILAIAAMAGLLLIGRGPPGRSISDIEEGSFEGDAEIFRAAPAPCQPVPSAIAWKEKLLGVYRNILEHRILALAAGMTFYSLLAIFPALAALVAIYSFFADPSAIAAHLNSLAGFLPGGAIDVAGDQLMRVASKGRQTLSWTFLLGFAISLWSANAAMKSLFDMLNVICGEREKRGFLTLNMVSLVFTLAAIAFVLLAIAAVVVLPVALNYIGLPDRTDLLLRVGRWPGLLVALTLSLAFIYRYGPSRDVSQWRWVSWGSAFAALLWLVTSAAFSWYAANFGTYNETYGSLGAAIGFMTWLWISSIAVLIGAEVDAAMERRPFPDAPAALELN
jgi:membrane protein